MYHFTEKNVSFTLSRRKKEKMFNKVNLLKPSSVKIAKV